MCSPSSSFSYNELFSRRGDWKTSKPLQSSLHYNSVECYVYDKENASRVHFDIIENCLKQFRDWVKAHPTEGGRFALNPTTEEQYPIESYLFLRVLRRKEDGIGRELLSGMSPKFSTDRLQRIWDQSVRITCLPPPDKEFLPVIRLWQQQKIQKVYEELEVALIHDKKTSSLGRFVFSKDLESLAKSKIEYSTSSLFRYIAAFFFSSFFNDINYLVS